MEYIKAVMEDANQIIELVEDTIREIYPKYYPKEVVDFFVAHHNEEKIREDIQKGNVWMLWTEDELAGTGSYEENHITRVYVGLTHQKKGYGSYIMGQLESVIKANYKKAILDASLPACTLYEKLGYRTVEHCRLPVENDVVLVYEIMEKEL